MKIQRLFSSILLCSSILNISNLHAEIHPLQASGVYEATKNEHKNISPLWGFVALHSRVLQHIRFFGHYDKKVDPRDPSRTIDIPLDPIANLIQRLFPGSVDAGFMADRSSSFVGNILSKNLYLIDRMIQILLDNQNVKDSQRIARALSHIFAPAPSPEYEKIWAILQQSSQQPRNAILTAIENLSQQLETGNQPNQLSKQLLSLGNRNKKEPIDSLLKTICSNKKNSAICFTTPNLGSTWKNWTPEQRAQQMSPFFDTVAKAFVAQDQLANVKNIKTQLYPENIVIISLLSFFIKVAENREDLNDLKSLLNKQIAAVDPFSKQQYRSIISNKETLHHTVETDPETTFLLSAGSEHYQASFPETEGVGSNRDCEANTVRNVLTIFSPRKNGQIDLTVWRSKFPNLNQDFIDFFTKYPSTRPTDHTKQSIHNEWDDISHHGIDIGLKGLINAIGHFTGDEELNKPWITKDGQVLQPWDSATDAEFKQEEEKRISYFLQKMSTPNRQITLKTLESEILNNYRRSYRGIFLINGQPAYDLNIGKHWDLDRLSSTLPAWKSEHENKSWAIPWISTLFPKPTIDHNTMVLNLYTLDPRKNEDFYAALHIIIQNNLESFYPLFEKWMTGLDNPIPTQDETKIIQLLYKHTNNSNNEHISQLKMKYLNLLSFELMCAIGDLSILQKAAQKMPDMLKQNINKFFGIALENKQQSIAQFLISNGANINSDYDNYLNNAISHHNIESVKFLLNLGADINFHSPYSDPPLSTAIKQFSQGKLSIEFVKLLLDHGASPTQTGGSQLTALDTVIASGNEELTALFAQDLAHYPSPLLDENKRAKIFQAMCALGNIHEIQEIKNQHPDLFSERLMKNLNTVMYNDQVKVLQFFLENGLDIHTVIKIKDSEYSLLKLAVRSDAVKIVKFLLDQEKFDLPPIKSALYLARMRRNNIRDDKTQEIYTLINDYLTKKGESDPYDY